MKGDKIYSKASELLIKMNAGNSNVTEQKKELFYNYFELLKKAAYLRHKNAMYDYAQQFEDFGHLGLVNPLFNLKKMNYWYKKAAETGHAEAYNNLASMYANGLGLENDDRKALEFYKKSADLDSDLGKKNYKIMLKYLAKDDLSKES